jgi:hypothetical protein
MSCKKDVIIYKAKPKIYDVKPYKFLTLNPELSSDKEFNVTLKGNFLNIRSVYVSSANDQAFKQTKTFFNPFSSIKNLSAKNIPFYAIKIQNFVFSENYLTFDLPEFNTSTSLVDVIIENEAGYSLLTEQTTIKPHNLCEITIPFQKPCSNGLLIINNS